VNVTRARTLAAVGAASGIVVFPLTGPLAESAPAWLAAPWPLSALLTAAGVIVLLLAWPVRQFVRGKRPEIDVLRSAATVALAKACSLVGVGLAGVYIAVALRGILTWDSPAARYRILLAAVAVVASAWLATAGQIGQLWCRTPPPPME
jgi:hypothetical protein